MDKAQDEAGVGVESVIVIALESAGQERDNDENLEVILLSLD
jgi:hypothetical protein